MEKVGSIEYHVQAHNSLDKKVRAKHGSMRDDFMSAMDYATEKHNEEVANLHDEIDRLQNVINDMEVSRQRQTHRTQTKSRARVTENAQAKQHDVQAVGWRLSDGRKEKPPAFSKFHGSQEFLYSSETPSGISTHIRASDGPDDGYVPFERNSCASMLPELTASQIDTEISSNNSGDDMPHVMNVAIRHAWRMDDAITQHTSTGFFSNFHNIRSIRASWDEKSQAVLQSADSMRSFLLAKSLKSYCTGCIISPTSRKRLAWDCLLTFCLAYDVIMIPFLLCFSIVSDTLQSITLTILIIWSADMIMSCVTGYMKHDVLVTSVKSICKRYVKSWFVFDVVVAGVDWVIYFLGTNANAARLTRIGKFLRMFRFLRMLRILRIVRVQHAFTHLSDTLLSEISRVRFKAFKIVVLLVLINHFIACLWYVIGTIEEYNGKYQSWVDNYELSGEPAIDRYLIAMQWAITNFGVGGSLIYPRTPAENFFAILVMICSLIAFSTIVSTVTNSYSYIQQVQGKEERDISQLQAFFRQHNVPRVLCRRVQRHCVYIRQRSQTQMQLSNVCLLEYASEQLKAELQHHIFSNFLEEHVLLGRLCSTSRNMMHQVSSEALEGFNVAFGDCLFYKGQVAAKMFFLPSLGVHGLDNRFVEYVLKCRQGFTGPSVITKQIGSGSWISEVGMWASNWMHAGHLRSVEDFCEVVTLKADTFARVVLSHPIMLGDIRNHAQTFVETMSSDFQHASQEEARLEEPVMDASETMQESDQIRALRVLRTPQMERFSDDIAAGANLIEVCLAQYDLYCWKGEEPDAAPDRTTNWFGLGGWAGAKGRKTDMSVSSDSTGL